MPHRSRLSPTPFRESIPDVDTKAGVIAIPEAVFSAPALRRLASRYLACTRAAAPTAERIVDKIPANFGLRGLIHVVLPNAVIRPHGSGLVSPRPRILTARARPLPRSFCWAAVGPDLDGSRTRDCCGRGSGIVKAHSRLSRRPGATASSFCARPASSRSALFKRHLRHRWRRSQSFPVPGGDDIAATSRHKRPRDDGGTDRCQIVDALRDFARAWP
jgi:hypothetical protein